MPGTFQSLVVKVEGDTGGLKKAMAEGGSFVSTFASQAAKALDSVTKSMGTPGTAAVAMGVMVVAGTAMAVKALYDMGSAWDNSTDKLVALTGAHGAELTKLEGVVETTYGQVTASLMDTTTVVGILGQTFHNLNATDMSAVSTQIINLAQLTGIDLKDATSAAAAMFADAGVKGKDMAGTLDMIKVAADNSGIPVLELMQNTQLFGTTFRNLGFSMAETLAIMAQAKATGVSVDVVLTGLRKSVASLVDPSKEARDALDMILGEKGAKRFFDTKDVGERFNKIRDILLWMEASGKHMEALDLSSKMFGKKSGQDILDMINKGTFSTDEMVKKLEKANGTIGRQKGETEDAGDQWVKFGHRFQVMIKPVAKAVFDLVNAISEKLIPVVEAIIGFLEDHQEILKVLGIIFGVVLVTAIYAFISGLVMLLMPLMIVVGVIGLVWTYWETVWNAILDVTMVVWDFLQAVFWAIVDWFTTAIPSALDAVGGFFASVWNWILSTVQSAWDGIQAVFWAIVDWFVSLPGLIWGAVAALAQLLWDWAWGALTAAWNAFITVFWMVLGWVTGIPGAIIEAGAALAQTLWDWAWGAFYKMVEAAGAAGMHILEWAGGLASAIFGVIADTAQTLWDIGSSIVGGIKTGIENAWGAFLDWIKKKIGSILDTIKDFLGIGSPSKVMAGLGVNMIEGLAQGIQDSTGLAVSAMESAAAQVSAVPIAGPAAPSAAAPTGAPPGLGTATGGLNAGVPAITGLPDPALTQATADTNSAITSQFAQGELALVQGTTEQQIASQAAFSATSIQMTADQMAYQNALWTNGLNLMVLTTAVSLDALNANTLSHFAILGQMVQTTMSSVVFTMTAGASSAADSFVAALNARIPPLQVTLAQYGESVKAYAREYLTSIGAPVTFAQGGLSGVERHDPTIARGGTMRVWNEPETGGEAYIPLGTNKRHRSTRILETVAGMFGFGLQSFAEGGMSLAELFWEANGGSDWKNGQNIGWTIGGHGDHVHAAGPPWEQIQAFLIGKGIPARPTSTTGGKHAAGSYHYSGRAADYGNSVNPVADIYFALLNGAAGGGLANIARANVPGPNAALFGSGYPAMEAYTMAQVLQVAMQKKLDDVRTYMMAAMAAAGGGTGSGPLAEYARSIMAQWGWGPEQWGPLDALITHESGWNPNAINPSSGAWGLFQFLGKGPFDPDPYSQIRRGFDYIASRYGSPAAAWAFWQGHHWYDQGGILTADNGRVSLAPGMNAVYNGLGRVENLGDGRDGAQAPIVGQLIVNPSEGMDERKLARKIKDVLREVREDDEFHAGAIR